jgi:hypothetical protein
MEKNLIDIQQIWDATDGGRTIIQDIYPDSAIGFQSKKNFKLRTDDKQASCTVFLDKTKKFYFLQDKGGSDTKAKTAIDILREHKNLEYFEALKYALEYYCNGSVSIVEFKHPEPKIEKLLIINASMEVVTKPDFTDLELKTLGNFATAEICKDFKLKAVEFYVTKGSEEKASYKISSTPDYPIYFYDYGKFGKIYQPLSKDHRFIYTGEKPTNHLFADARTEKLLKRAYNNLAIYEEEDNDEETEAKSDPRLDEIIIATGPSDAMAIYANGYRVVWLNSETAKFTSYEYTLLKKLAKHTYILPDIDKTGVREALKIAVKFLDIKIIWLPEDLKNFKDWKGKPCKDVRDFFRYYKNVQYSNLEYYFKQLVKTAIPLRFWNEISEYTKDGKFKGIKYEINNEQCYKFLNACGFYTMETKMNKSKKDFSYIHILENTNIVREIKEEEVEKYINGFLAEFVRKKLEYFNINLLNTIHRSRQINSNSLYKLEKIQLDFKSFDERSDHFFFKNTALKITAEGLEPIKLTEINKYIFDFKIIDHNFSKTPPMFNIEFSPEYQALKDKRKLIADRKAPEYIELTKKMMAFDPLDKYTLEILNNDFSFLKFIYNTGRMYWENEERGEELTEKQKKEVNLIFISKIAALGYFLFRYKNPSLPYALYATEIEKGDIGQHRGGTGKSLTFKYTKEVRKLAFIDGQSDEFRKDTKHLYSEVVKDITDVCYFDDLNMYVDLHMFLPAITGNMTVKSLFKDKYIIEYEESPKIGISSNHTPSKIDPSVKRRLWFVAFSNYYHPENRKKNISERTPFNDFKKNLVKDYSIEEMNLLYNFWAQCLQTFLKFNERINPPMDIIEKKCLQRLLGDDFVMWAEDYFTEDKLNIFIEKAVAFNDYKNYIPESDRKRVTSHKFKQNLINYAEYAGFIFNPTELLQSETEKERNQIKRYNDDIPKRQVEYFYFKTEFAEINLNESEENSSTSQTPKPPF